MNINLGEKIETILRSQKNGNFGLHLTDSHVRIDGKTYRIDRGVEVDQPYWTVTNLTDMTVAVAHERFDLGMIKESSFAREASNIF
jgi:hypothetical protein